MKRQILLEALITERKGMEAENQNCIAARGHVVYDEKDFNRIADRMRDLLEDECSRPKLQWSKLNYGPMEWHDAIELCKNLEEDDYTGWHLPTIVELITLINFTKNKPASNLNLEPSHYWSSTTHTRHKARAWRVNFCYGDSYYNDKSNSHYVRAVRYV